jgi:hypothetical protein
MKKRLALGLAAAVIAFLVVKAFQHKTPKGQPPLSDLTQGNFHDFESTFDSSNDSVRLLVLLSPT